MHQLRKVLGVFVLLLLVVALSASTVIAGAPAIIYVSPSGDDTAGDGTSANPYATFAKALGEANSGDTVHALAGIYTENIELDKPLSLVGDGASVTTIDCDSGYCILIGKDASSVQIEGFTITGGGSAIVAEGEGEDLAVVIKNNVIEENDGGGIQLAAQYGIDAVISGNKINSNGCRHSTDGFGGAVRMWLDEDGELIKANISGNEIMDNDGGGIRLGWWSKTYNESAGDIDAVISGNKIWNNEGGAIRVKAMGEVEVEITDNDFRNIEENNGGGIIRLGFGSCSDSTISEKLSALIEGNSIDCGTFDDYVYSGGIIRALADTTDIAILNNEIKAGYDVGGLIRIGFADEYDLVASDVTAVISGNDMDLQADALGGAIRIYAVDTVDAEVCDNRIVGDDGDGGPLEGGAIRIGRLCSRRSTGLDHTKTVRAVVTGNIIDPFKGGGIRIVASEEVEARVSGNTITGCYGGAIRIGWDCYSSDEGNSIGLRDAADTLTHKVTPVVHAMVEDNVLIDNYAVGIHIEGAEKVGGSIASNIVLNTQKCDRESAARYNHPGIYVGNSDATDVALMVKGNIIAGNITGLINETAATLDAGGNWWGHADGPTHASNPGGKGDSFEGALTFSPWFELGTDTLEVDQLTPGTTMSVTLKGVTFTFTPSHRGRIVFSVDLHTGEGLGHPAGTDPAGIYLEIKALGLMGAPVSITVPYDPKQLPEGMDEENLRLYHYHNGAWELLSNQVVDKVNHCITATTPGFSIFGLFAAAEEPEKPADKDGKPSELPKTSGFPPLALAGGLTALLGACVRGKKRVR